MSPFSFLNGDWAVDALDAEILDDHWFDSEPAYEDGDLNGDGDVNADDIDLMFAQYGLELAVAGRHKGSVPIFSEQKMGTDPS
jgi:hypothetical protein